MMAIAAQNWDLKIWILDTSARTFLQGGCCDRFIEGSFKDYDAVYQFGKQVDVLTLGNRACKYRSSCCNWRKKEPLFILVLRLCRLYRIRVCRSSFMSSISCLRRLFAYLKARKLFSAAIEEGKSLFSFRSEIKNGWL